jgi:hypothetical protein
MAPGMRRRRAKISRTDDDTLAYLPVIKVNRPIKA